MDNLQLSQGGSFAFASGALAAGTSAGTIKTTVVVPYTVDGTWAAVSKAITDNIAIVIANLVATFSTPANGSFSGASVGGSVRFYGVYLDSAGVVTLTPGRITNALDLANGVDTLQYPAPIKGKCCIGALRVSLTAATAFVPGVTALNAAGVTSTFVNFFAIPGEPVKV